jgi:hypothetical protein
MSRTGATKDLPSTTHMSVASDTAAPLQGERLSEGTRTENVSKETSDATAQNTLQGERLFEDSAASEKVPQTLARTEIIREETTVDDNDVLWVDWDGPTDPMNPKKWVVRLLFVTI